VDVLKFSCRTKGIIIRSGKGDKDRVTLLPGFLHGPLKTPLNAVKTVNTQDLAKGYGAV